MEDHNQSRNQPDADKEEKILDLTKEMELADQARHKIYDLGDGTVIQEAPPQEEKPLSTPPPINESESAQSAPSGADESEKNLLTDEGSDIAVQPDGPPESDELTPTANGPLSDAESMSMEMPPLEAADRQEETGDPSEGIGPASEPEQPFDESAEMLVSSEDSNAAETPFSIEDEVDAAFDAVQFEEPQKDPEEEKSDQLFDKLSGITQMVDDAVRQINTDDAPQQAPAPPADDATLTSDAAEFDAAISGEDEDDEIIELTEIVDPAEVMAGEASDAGEDDIIDLVDIVDPADLEVERLAKHSDSMESEPADHIDDARLTSGASFPDAASEPEPAPESSDTPDQTEEALGLSDMEDFDMNANGETDADRTEDIDAAEMDELIREADLIIGEEEFTEMAQQAEGQESNEEEIILLTDVLKKGSGEEPLPTADSEEAKEIDEATASNAGMASDTLDAAPSPPDDKEQEVLSNGNIEAAVERLLKTKYADTIQKMVAEAVEKAVTREVENIRQGLSDQDAP